MVAAVITGDFGIGVTEDRAVRGAGISISHLDLSAFLWHGTPGHRVNGTWAVMLVGIALYWANSRALGSAMGNGGRILTALKMGKDRAARVSIFSNTRAGTLLLHYRDGIY